MSNIGQLINNEIKSMGNKYCEDLCPYRQVNSILDEWYELPCSVDKCYVQGFITFLTFEVGSR